MIRLLAILLGFILWADPVRADDGPPGGGFDLPVQCRLGEQCWVVNYLDMDPGKGAKDPACSHRTYDGHDGTDFGLRNWAAAEAGIAILAAADGKVVGIRDGEEDGLFVRRIPIESKMACGNRVAIAHGDGWLTDYCHMKKGSVAVAVGQRVKRGDTLGLIGESGWAEFPHVHFTIRKGKTALDPFSGTPSGQCGTVFRGLWKDPIAYRPFAMVDAGFAGAPLNNAGIWGEAKPVLAAKDRPLMLWVALLGPAKNDRMAFTITGPGGQTLLDHAKTLDKNQARRWESVGKKPPSGGWPAGLYRGEVSVTRDGMTETKAVTWEAP